jgi:hypothetical protein
MEPVVPTVRWLVHRLQGGGCSTRAKDRSYPALISSLPWVKGVLPMLWRYRGPTHQERAGPCPLDRRYPGHEHESAGFSDRRNLSPEPR